MSVIDSPGITVVRERYSPEARFTKERMVMMMLHSRHLGWGVCRGRTTRGKDVRTGVITESGATRAGTRAMPAQRADSGVPSKSRASVAA
jgi:hypothetical protein